MPYGSPCLSGFVTCSVISSCGSHPLWVLCSIHCLVSLAIGWVCFWPAVSTAPVRCGVQSRLPFVVGPPSQVSVGPSPALAVGWFGHRSVAPPVCWALVGSLLRRSVTLGSCAPYPVGSSLEDSYGFVVQAPGVFLDSLLGFFPLASGGYGWLGVVVACTSCGVPYLRLALCSSACVCLGGCPSFSQVGPAHSHWVPLLWTWCA